MKAILVVVMLVMGMMNHAPTMARPLIGGQNAGHMKTYAAANESAQQWVFLNPMAGVQSDVEHVFDTGNTFSAALALEPVGVRCRVSGAPFSYVEPALLLTMNSTRETPRIGATLHFEEYVVLGLVSDFKRPAALYLGSTEAMQTVFDFLAWGWRKTTAQ